MAELSIVDPDVKIPPAVKAAILRGEETFKNVYAPPAEGDPPPQPVADETGQPPADPPVAADPPAAGEPPAVPPEVTPPGNEKEIDWKHRYESMKGRLDRSQAQLRTMSEQIASLQNSLATRQVATPPEPRQDTPRARLITPEEESDYGVDFLKVVGRRAKEELEPEVDALRQELESLKGQMKSVGGYVAGDAQQRMEAQLDSSIPEWRTLNNDQNFLAWLQLPDPYTGAIRQDLLTAAHERNATPQVHAFFKGFLSEEAATAPPVVPPDQEQRPAVTKIPLETFAAPGRAKTAAASVPVEKPTFTRAQITKIYADSAAGKYRGREAEMTRLDAQIIEAGREGRIR